MKPTVIPFSLVLICGILLAACAPQIQPETLQPVPLQPTALQPSDVQPTLALNHRTVSPPPTAATTAAAPAAHTNVPADLPAGNGIFIGDQSTVTSSNKERAFAGDRFTLGKFERPYNANTMDVYYPFVDIVSANIYPGSLWTYVRITLVGPDTSKAFPAKYAVEIDKNMDGRGDMLVIVDHPASQDWTNDGVRVLADKNGDVGGAAPVMADSAGMKGDGYESVVFDQGQGQDPDAAWARVPAKDPMSVELAFKTALLEGDATYMAGVWAGTDSLDPALFDLNDHFTHEQAGEANPDIANFYPIKALFELDNTCRGAIGFTPSGREPAICS